LLKIIGVKLRAFLSGDDIFRKSRCNAFQIAYYLS